MDCGMVDGWPAVKQNGVHAHGPHVMHMGYHTAMKRSEALTQATVWMNLDHTMLTQKQTQKLSLS